jgi:hypothetical protein
MRLATLCLCLLMCGAIGARAATSSPATSATSATTAAPARIKVLVLDVKSTVLNKSEIETLTSLITAHLGAYGQLDVLSGDDVKRLIDLEGQKQVIGCDQRSCLAELAGAMGANLVVFGQAGRLGSTTVVTLNLFDAQKGQAVARRPVEVQDLGELPARVATAIDEMVGPLLQGQRTTPVTSSTPPATLVPAPTRSTPQTTARARELFDAKRVDVCVGTANKTEWWFCTHTAQLTENAFARQYRDITQQGDLERADVNRAPSATIVPIALVAGGGAAALAGTYFTLVANKAAPGPPFIDGSTAVTLGAVGIVGGLTCVLYGALDFMKLGDVADGTPTQHTLSEAEGRAACDRYNAALLPQINRELGAP